MHGILQQKASASLHGKVNDASDLYVRRQRSNYSLLEHEIVSTVDCYAEVWDVDLTTESRVETSS